MILEYYRYLTEVIMEELKTIPFIAHEAETARLERTHKRLTTVTIILIVLLVTTNLYWVCRLVK